MHRLMHQDKDRFGMKRYPHEIDVGKAYSAAKMLVGRKIRRTGESLGKKLGKVTCILFGSSPGYIGK